MIDSVDEFVDLADNGDHAGIQRMRTETATESFWFEVINRRPDLVRTVTLNKRLPAGVLELLADHHNSLVRTDIANRRSLPIHLFKKLSRDQDPSVRARVACNKKTPADILLELTRDPIPFVAAAARQRLSGET